MLRKATAFLAAVVLSGLCGSLVLAEEPEVKEGDTGTVEGTLTAKGEKWIDVAEEGKSDAVRYTPNWIGGAPKDGGGLDKEMLAAIAKLEVGSKVRVEWKFEERLRVVKVEVLDDDGDEGEGEGDDGEGDDDTEDTEQ